MYLKKADPSAHILAALFNAIMRTEHFPPSWKESVTTLLHKKGEVGEINNWRPISLGDTTPKLFASLLADRLKHWAKVNERFSQSQKGFLEFDGCFEHNFVLQEILREAKPRKRELVCRMVRLNQCLQLGPPFLDR